MGDSCIQGVTRSVISCDLGQAPFVLVGGGSVMSRWLGDGIVTSECRLLSSGGWSFACCRTATSFVSGSRASLPQGHVMHPCIGCGYHPRSTDMGASTTSLLLGLHACDGANALSGSGEVMVSRQKHCLAGSQPTMMVSLDVMLLLGGVTK